MISWWGPLWDVLLLVGTFGVFVLCMACIGRVLRVPSTCPNCGALVRVTGECPTSGRDWFRCDS